MHEILLLFIKFIKISLVSFGGGSVIISLIQKEFVENGDISKNEFINVLALSQATPGPVAGSAATYIGYKLYGTVGSIVSNIAVALPSLIIVIVLFNIFRKISNKSFDNFFRLLRPVIIALILSVIIFLLRTSIFTQSQVNFGALIIFVVSIILLKFKEVNPIYIIIISGVAAIFII